MEAQEELSLICPYCGTEGSALIDLSGGPDQTEITDCETCCRPMVVTISEDENGEPTLYAERE